MADIKESLELVEGLKILGVAGRKVARGGLTKEDLVLLLDLLKDHQKLIDAAYGVDKLKSEVTDLDSSEIAILGAKVLDAIKAIREA